MNPKLASIFARRSIRKFNGQAISDEVVHDLLEAAMAAPSAVAKDPWNFIVVRDRQTLEQIASALPNGKFLPEAGLGIVICGDLQRVHGGELSYLLQDCSAAIENLLLAADLLGLGACWLGVHPRPDRIAHIATLFRLPPHILPVSAIAIGVPAEQKPARTRYRTDAVHREAW